MTEVITPSDSNWSEGFLIRTQPNASESLAGYLLRVDNRNDFPAGGSIRASRRYGAAAGKLGTPGMLFTGRGLDLARLAVLAGCESASSIESLTIQPLQRWLYGSGRSRLRGHANGFRVCPACALDEHIPFTAMFKDVAGCVEHRLKLVDRCSCGTRLRFFADQNPFSCHAEGCVTEYEHIASEVLTDSELEDTAQRTRVYRDLADVATSREVAPLSRAELGRALRTLFHRAGLQAHETGTGRNVYNALGVSGYGPSLQVVTTLMSMSGASVDDFLAAARAESPAGPPLTRWLGEHCPAPSCPAPADRVLGRSRPKGGMEVIERCCMVCGCRFAGSRVRFAFDIAPGYPSWRAEKNRRRLATFRRTVRETCESFRRQGRRIVRKEVWRVAGVPGSLSYLTPRAGLVEIIDEYRSPTSRWWGTAQWLGSENSQLRFKAAAGPQVFR